MTHEKDRAWLKKWNATIGSSRAPIITGDSRWGSRLRTYHEMRGSVPLRNLDHLPDIRRGRMLEPIAIQLIEEQGFDAPEPWPQDEFIHGEDKGYPWAHCIPDLENPGGGFFWEVKWPRPEVWRRCYLHGMLAEYEVQCRHSMAVTSLATWGLAVCNPVTMEILVRVIEYDAVEEVRIMEAEKEFFCCVQSGTELQDTTEEERERAKFASGSGGVIDVIEDLQAARAAAALIEAHQIKKDAEELYQFAKHRLQEAGGDREAVEVRDPATGCPLVRFYHREQRGRKKVDMEILEHRHPEAFRECVTYGESFRSFRTYILKG